MQVLLKHGLKCLAFGICKKRKRGGDSATRSAKGTKASCGDIFPEFDISNLTELYKRSCRDLDAYKSMLAHGGFDRELFDVASQVAFTRRLKRRISQLERTVAEHLAKLLERPGAGAAKKEQQLKRALEKYEGYDCNRKLLLLLTNQPRLQKRDPDRLRMSGTTQSYNIHDSA